MVVTAIQSNLKLGRTPSRAFKVLFALATVIAAGATYIAITETSPGAAQPRGLMWFLWGNLVLIGALAAVLGSRVWRLIKENRESDGGARLRLRITLLFSLAAAVPTVIVAGFLALTINRAVDDWFGEPVMRIVENSVRAAEAAQDDLLVGAGEDFEAVRADLASCNECRNDPANLYELAEFLAQYRNFTNLAVLTGNREVVLALPETAPAFPAEEFWDEAGNGLIKIYNDAVRGLSPLPGYDGLYLYAVRPVPADIGEHLQEASNDWASIQAANERSDEVRGLLTLSYIEAAALMLLGTAWLGMAAASRIASPIGQLAQAARTVRDGDLTVRMQRPEVRDEVDDLADAFNQMTERISRQTKALDNSRLDAERRSAFTEAVLAGIEAGVIRVDGDLKVTVANSAAQRILGFDFEPNGVQHLADVAGPFVEPTKRAVELGGSVEASIKREEADGITHLQVRIAPEPEAAGAVVTFHDTTRLVNDQRQAAWRDVARRIAHEIRNPLTPIQLSAERLKRRFSKQIETDRETFQRCTDTITRQVSDIGRMVEEFSDFARMPKPTFGAFDLCELLQTVTFARRMATPNLTIEVVIDDDAVEMVGDERMLGQAFTNVIKNASEAVERHIETGSIKSGLVSVEVSRNALEAHIVVRDNGPGFPETDRNQFLEPYVTTRKNGVGLGLAIVTRIVDDHGGTISLGRNDKTDHGAIVEIRLPITAAKKTTPLELANQDSV